MLTTFESSFCDRIRQARVRTRAGALDRDRAKPETRSYGALLPGCSGDGDSGCSKAVLLYEISAGDFADRTGPTSSNNSVAVVGSTTWVFHHTVATPQPVIRWATIPHTYSPCTSSSSTMTNDDKTGELSGIPQERARRFVREQKDSLMSKVWFSWCLLHCSYSSWVLPLASKLSSCPCLDT
jgi:hypothetical protein